MSNSTTPGDVRTTDPAPGFERRTVLKGAAWSVPVVALAVAAPIAAASVPAAQQDVIVTSSCYGLSILGVGISYPEFRILAVGAPILAGSTFLITGVGIGNLTIGDTSGLGVLNLLNPSTVRYTLTSDIPAGGAAVVRVTGLASVQALRTYTMTAQTILGNANAAPGNDSASQTLVGGSLFGLNVGYCGR